MFCTMKTKAPNKCLKKLSKLWVWGGGAGGGGGTCWCGCGCGWSRSWLVSTRGGGGCCFPFLGGYLLHLADDKVLLGPLPCVLLHSRI